MNARCLGCTSWWAGAQISSLLHHLDLLYPARSYSRYISVTHYRTILCSCSSAPIGCLSTLLVYRIERVSDNIILVIIAKLKAAANYLHYFFIFTGVSTNHPWYPIDDVRHRDLSPTLPSNSKTLVSVCLHLLKPL